MKALFDTSALFAAMNVHHPHHNKIFPWALKVMRHDIQGYLSNHGLAEMYSVWTRHPQLKITPKECQRSLVILQEHFTIINLDVHDYNAVLARMTRARHQIASKEIQALVA